MRRNIWYGIVGLGLLIALLGCIRGRPDPPRGVQPRQQEMTVTAYCPCKQCCGWRRNWWFRPVYAYGSLEGERKEVGVTASGTKARPGTIAADTSLYPFGTVMYVPGYGYGRVEDRGGAIKGQHIDVFFKDHKAALKWGRQRLNVVYWPR